MRKIDQRRSSETGFTLLELLIVVSLIVLIFGIVAVNTKSSLQRASFQQDIECFIADFNLCRTYTFNQGRICTLEIEEDGREYQYELPKSSDDNERNHPDRHRKFKKRLSCASIESIERLTSGKKLSSIEFTLDGNISAFVVRFTGNGDQHQRILVPGVFGEKIRSVSQSEVRSMRNALSS